MTFHIEILFIAVVAWVYAEMLTEAGMIFNRPYVWAQEHLPDMLFRPLIGCVYCVAGQMALWYYPFFFEYSVFDHIFFICSTILTVKIIDKILTYNAS